VTLEGETMPTSTPRLDVRTPEDAEQLGTVLGVWAHPDDEAYLSSGLMALARRAGSHVACVTATRGEHGTDDPERWPPARLARTRDLEVAAAMAVLGVEDHRCLEIEDGTLADQDRVAAVSRLARLVEDLRPDTIVTFGPEGMTGHPDHRTVSTWVTDAWWRTGARARLLYATTTDAFADEFADLHDEIGVFGPGLPLRTPLDEVAVRVHLDSALQDVKFAALRAQATQVQPLVALMGEDRFVSWWRTETFTAAPSVPGIPAGGHVHDSSPRPPSPTVPACG
jgi:LmbE family N-acetylglucosaminyl deacetylase